MIVSLLTRTLVKVRLALSRLGLVSLEEFSPGMSLDEIEDEYRQAVYDAIADYLQSSKAITSFRNEHRRAVNDSFTLAFYAGRADASATGEIPDEDIDWLNERIESEISFSDDMFQKAKLLRADKETSLEDKLAWAQARANGYTGALAGVYAQGKMRGEPDVIGVWRFGDTDHCDTCADLNGQEHPLSWFLDNGYIPQEKGSDTLDCGGWNCQCHIDDAETGEQLIP